MVLETERVLPLLDLQKRLGGTVKIAEVINKANSAELFAHIEKIVKHRAKSASGKYCYGFSVFGYPRQKELLFLGLKIKRELKNGGRKIKFVVSKENNLSSVIVKREKLLMPGLDLVIAAAGDSYFLAATKTIQDYVFYSERDYGRPARDDSSGLLPPKLAKILINLARCQKRHSILDPFCGSGTILQEALLMGFNNLIGSDISEKAVLDCRNNLNWLKNKFNSDISGARVFQSDVLCLPEKLQACSQDAIISEPYLGEQKKSRVGKQNLRDLEIFYIACFKKFYQLLKEGGIIVFILPVIEGKELDILGDIKKIGFYTYKLSNTMRGSLIYKRDGQRVAREIFRFIKGK